ncbi:hypothetical protein [Agromyces silvae]|uniref:hypothetical protein n=1 Tax=Agromyces silvae TaxID=3388266 RepID=UPI00280B3F7A|nr:hypothetical protein [Agromyces protaetiae]
MPVVTVVAPPHPATRALLAAVADTLADTLGLADGDVIATSVASGEYVASGDGSNPDRSAGAWPVVTIHGSDRGAEAMTAARDAAARAVAEWGRTHAIAIEGVWCEWLLPHPS